MPTRKTIARPAPKKTAVKKTTVKTKPLAKRAPLAALTRPSSPELPHAARKPVKQRAKLVRDGFTMPEDDFALIAALKLRALGAHREAKKSELLRAGLHALMALDGPALVAALGRLQPLKVGRPKKSH
jgi:hypothetical protein